MTAPTVLNFVIPVRHHESVSDWSGVVRRMAHSFRSLEAQTSPNWRATIVANHGCPLPKTSARFDIVRVNFPFARLPSEKAEPDAFYEAVRSDKGRRIEAGMMQMQAARYTMIMDYDDFVDHSLVQFVDESPSGPGWIVTDGFFFDGSRTLYRCDGKFNDYCGTSLIVRTDLFRPTRDDWVHDIDYVRRALGSHRFLAKDLAASGNPLVRVPFPATVYRIGYVGNSSQSGSVRQKLFGMRTSIGHPLRTLTRIASLRRMTRDLEKRFFAGDHRLDGLIEHPGALEASLPDNTALS